MIRAFLLFLSGFVIGSSAMQLWLGHGVEAVVLALFGIYAELMIQRID